MMPLISPPEGMAVSQSSDSEWYKRAQQSIAHAALTNSKRPETLVKGVYPTHINDSKGCYVFANGRRYVDFICGLGTNLLGYGNEEVAQVIAQQAYRGISPSFSTEIEVLAAEKVKELFPWIEQVRFLKTGGESCSAAVRIARTFRKESFLLSQGYHGWHDEFVSLTPPSLGVPEETGNIFDLNLWENSQLLGPQGIGREQTIILEPVELDSSPKRIDYLKELKSRKSNPTIIHDEIITGFRYLSHSVSKHHGVRPDLICLGKAIANGMPLAVVGGKKEIMECDEYFVSSTFAGETLSLVAALKTMTLLQTKYNVADLWSHGKRFQDEFNSFLPGVQLNGYATRARLEGDPLQKALFMQEACKANIIFGPSWFISFSHIGILDDVLKTCQAIFLKIKNGMVKLEGQMPKSPFAERLRK